MLAGVFLVRRSWRALGSCPADGPLLLLALCLCLSLAAGALQGSLPGLAMPLATACKQAEYLAGFLIARAVAPDWTLERAARLTFRTAAWLGAAALAERQLQVLMGIEEIRIRVFSHALWPDQTNHLAGFLALGAVLGLALRPQERTRLPFWIWTGLEGLILLGLMATGSRGALLATVAGALVFAAAQRSWKVLAAGILLLAAGVATQGRGGFTHELVVWQHSEIRQEAGAPRLPEMERNRLDVWTALRGDVLRFPLFGAGPGSRNRVFYESQWVMTLAEGGVLGLAALLLVLIALGRSAIAAGGALGAAMLGILACVVVQGFVTETLLVTRIAGPFWLLWGAFLSGRAHPPPGKLFPCIETRSQ